MEENTNYPAVQFRIARPINNLEEIVAFYTKGLGLAILYEFKGHQGYDGVMIGLPGMQYYLEFTTTGLPVQSKAPTKDHLLVLYFKETVELDKIRTRLKSPGHQPVAPENPYWKDNSWDL
jgi:hypothetical protein